MFVILRLLLTSLYITYRTYFTYSILRVHIPSRSRVHTVQGERIASNFITGLGIGSIPVGKEVLTIVWDWCQTSLVINLSSY